MVASSLTPTIQPPELPKLYAKQYQAIFSPCRYSIIEASTKAGKTAGCLEWLYTYAWNDGKPGYNYWWIAPVYTQAKMAFERLVRMLKASDPLGLTFRVNLTELRVRLVNGGSIWFKGSDKPDSLYGEDVRAGVMDESSRMKEAAWHAVRSTLTATQGPLRIIGNVRGRRNWSYQLARRAEAGTLPNAAYFKLTALDAVAGGVIPAQEIEDARLELPESVFRELYLAEPTDDGANPFGISAIDRAIMELSGRPPVAFGVDLAKKRDFTVVCGLDEEGCVTTLERWQSDWGQTRRRILDLIGDVPALIDSTGVGDPIVEDIQRHTSTVEGFVFTSSPLSKQRLMEGLAASIQQGEIHFPDGWLKTELESFEYEHTRHGVRYSAPQGMTDDGVCGLALANRCRQTLVHSRVEIVSERFVAFG